VQGFQVAPLAFVEEDVEGQGGFARAGYPGDHREGVARDVHVDAFQVVLAGVQDVDVGAGRGGGARGGFAQDQGGAVSVTSPLGIGEAGGDRKSTRLNSSHVKISYAVFCLKKKKHMYELNMDADRI